MTRAQLLSSIAIVYIVAAMFALPAIDLAPQLTTPFLHFGRLVGMAVRWNFFAPFPMAANYFDYIVFQEGDGLPIAHGQFPEEADRVMFDNGRRRFLMISQSMATDLKKVDRYFVPWLCRKYPNAKGVNVRKVVLESPSLEVARANSSVAVRDLRQTKIKFEKNSDCPKGAP